MVISTCYRHFLYVNTRGVYMFCLIRTPWYFVLVSPVLLWNTQVALIQIYKQHDLHFITGKYLRTINQFSFLLSIQKERERDRKHGKSHTLHRRGRQRGAAHTTPRTAACRGKRSAYIHEDRASIIEHNQFTFTCPAERYLTFIMFYPLQQQHFKSQQNDGATVQ